MAEVRRELKSLKREMRKMRKTALKVRERVRVATMERRKTRKMMQYTKGRIPQIGRRWQESWP